MLGIDLVLALDSQYPEKCPDPRDSEREVWIKAGHRQVVNQLLSLLKEQEDNVLL